jgi:hypothetical protein
MAIYKNRPFMEPETELRRYVSIDALICMLRDRQLRLTRVEWRCMHPYPHLPRWNRCALRMDNPFEQ